MKRWEGLALLLCISVTAGLIGLQIGKSVGYSLGVEQGKQQLESQLFKDASSPLLATVCFRWWFGGNHQQFQHSVEQICKTSRQKK